ncbi:DUF3850 domain-containing protein [Cronobacter dublinensis]
MSEIRKPVTHNLKIWPEHYSAVCAGVKRAELRKNDRDYRAGDTVDLCEWDKDDESFTGEFISVTVTHVADVSEWMPGYVLLSIELALRERAEPVGWTDEQELRDVNERGCGYLFTVNPITPHADPRRVIKLYAEPPAPVVPDEQHSERFDWSYENWANHLGGRHQNNDPACYYEFGSFMAVAEMLRQFGNVQRKVGWNACRAAMLAAPVKEG